MRISTHRDGGTAHVALAGELDLASGRDLDAVLRRAVEEGASRVHLDLTECTFIDSSGIGVLLRWREDFDATGRAFEVTGAQGTVRRIFRVTGVLGG